MGAKLQVGLNLSPGTGLSSWFFLSKGSQSHILGKLYMLRGEYLSKDITLSLELGRGEQKMELTVIPLDSQ